MTTEGEKKSIYWGLCRCMELVKKSTIIGDEPDLFKAAQGRNSLNSATCTASSNKSASTTNQELLVSAKINLENITTINDGDNGYVPTVGRWGSEWPS